MINRCIRRRIAQPIVASCERLHDQSSRAATDRTINRCVRRRIARPSWHLRPIVRLVVPPVAESNRERSRVAALPNVMSYDGWHHKSSGDTTSCTTSRAIARSAIIHNWWCDHTRLVVRSRKTYCRQLTIWNGKLDVLNITIDLDATDFSLAITYDLCDQSCVRFSICPRFKHFSVSAAS